MKILKSNIEEAKGKVASFMYEYGAPYNEFVAIIFPIKEEKDTLYKVNKDEKGFYIEIQ